MKTSIAAAAALLLNAVAMPAGAAQDGGQSGARPSAPAPGVDGDAQCAMFMRNIIVAMLVRGNLSAGERRYFDRYGVLFNYFAGRFSVGHEAAAAIPVLTATVRGLSRDVQARMDCYNDGDRTMTDVRAQIERALPAERNAVPAAPPASSGAADDDARCIAAVQRVVNERVRLIAREEMRNPDHVFRAVEYHAGRLVVRGGATAIEPAIRAAFAALPADEAAADTLGFRCVADVTRASGAFSDAIAEAERAAEEAGPAGK